ncbi:hypothetical protein LX36DRAFT_163563 [Colletotrichum falcatum]|nr:hypothetical protein LX36DRAFT_163563 [Colletotrichum falcatum]
MPSPADFLRFFARNSSVGGLCILGTCLLFSVHLPLWSMSQRLARSFLTQSTGFGTERSQEWLTRILIPFSAPKRTGRHGIRSNALVLERTSRTLPRVGLEGLMENAPDIPETISGDICHGDGPRTMAGNSMPD